MTQANPDTPQQGGINYKLLNTVLWLVGIAAVVITLAVVVPKLMSGAKTVDTAVVTPAAQEVSKNLNQIPAARREEIITANESHYFRGKFVPTDGYDKIKFYWFDQKLGYVVMEGDWNLEDGRTGVHGYVIATVGKTDATITKFFDELPEKQ